MAESGLNPKAINLVSLGYHSRRSRLLFEKAFGESTEIGVIAIRNIGYDPETWWRSSFGFKDVLGETIAWIYASFFSGRKISLSFGFITFTGIMLIINSNEQ